MEVLPATKPLQKSPPRRACSALVQVGVVMRAELTAYPRSSASRGLPSTLSPTPRGGADFGCRGSYSSDLDQSLARSGSCSPGERLPSYYPQSGRLTSYQASSSRRSNACRTHRLLKALASRGLPSTLSSHTREPTPTAEAAIV